MVPPTTDTFVDTPRPGPSRLVSKGPNQSFIDSPRPVLTSGDHVFKTPLALGPRPWKNPGSKVAKNLTTELNVMCSESIKNPSGLADTHTD